jgi:hypothetical protein
MKNGVIFIGELKTIQTKIQSLPKEKKSEKKKLISFCKSLKHDIKLNKPSYANVPENREYSIILFNLQYEYNEWIKKEKR